MTMWASGVVSHLEYERIDERDFVITTDVKDANEHVREFDSDAFRLVFPTRSLQVIFLVGVDHLVRITPVSAILFESLAEFGVHECDVFCERLWSLPPAFVEGGLVGEGNVFVDRAGGVEHGRGRERVLLLRPESEVSRGAKSELFESPATNASLDTIFGDRANSELTSGVTTCDTERNTADARADFLGWSRLSVLALDRSDWYEEGISG